MSNNYPPELVERMARYIRWTMDDTDACVLFGKLPRTELREILSLLSKPIDPDLLEARESAALYAVQEGRTAELIAGYRTGEYDESDNVQRILFHIKRQRQQVES